ncbi:hypothetical protein HWV62_31947 [Athelia sp. TMB]|nr:hypothetical protein HWV62_31947 [Athelia sp. TMB]
MPRSEAQKRADRAYYQSLLTHLTAEKERQSLQKTLLESRGIGYAPADLPPSDPPQYSSSSSRSRSPPPRRPNVRHNQRQWMSPEASPAGYSRTFRESMSRAHGEDLDADHSDADEEVYHSVHLRNPTPYPTSSSDEGLQVLREVKVLTEDWVSSIGPLDDWAMLFQKGFDAACEKHSEKTTQEEVDDYLRTVEEHARHGRLILQKLRRSPVIQPPPSHAAWGDYLAAGDMLDTLYRGILFLEVRLDILAPRGTVSADSDSSIRRWSCLQSPAVTSRAKSQCDSFPPLSLFTLNTLLATMVAKSMGRAPRTTSQKTKHFGKTRSNGGVRLLRPQRETLTNTAMLQRQAAEAEQMQKRVRGELSSEISMIGSTHMSAEMNATQLRNFQDLQELPEDDGDEDWIMANDVLTGAQPIDISHAGGELLTLAGMHEEYTQTRRRRRPDFRTRHNRTELRNRSFATQLPALTQAYMDWSFRTSNNQPSPIEETANSGWCHVHVVDTFTVQDVRIVVPENDTLLTALLRQGLVPSAPDNPSVCIAIEALELFRVANLRCPRLSVQAYTKTLCDLHQVPFRRYLSTQLSIARDLYLAIRASVDKLVQGALGRDSPNWRLRHACPACTYKLQDEKPLLFSLLFTMDGNDSLKRIQRYTLDENGSSQHSAEAIDSRAVNDGLYLAREEVDKWADENIEDMMSSLANEEEVDADADYGPCVDRWKNMKEDITKRMWGIFDETGIFLALCRHGFALVLADMVKSGELAKYPLAVANLLLHTFGKDLGGGYDIGCKFKSTLLRSPLAPLVRDLNYTSLVGSFHGHAHRRLCQLSHLATYTKGLGDEDLEGCERAFSKSNELASTIRHASVFHRKQAIDNYFRYNDDLEVYYNLTTFLHNNYEHALDTLHSGPLSLAQAMVDLGVTEPSTFEQWRAEEQAYLEGLSREPLHETLEMEYYQKLVNLEASKHEYETSRTVWLAVGPAEAARGYASADLSIEAARRKLLATYEKDLKIVLDLEEKLDINTRWTPQSEEWARAGNMVAMRRYQRALDKLEGLIVARMFELTKMNMSQTGYKMRKHVAKALQSRSQAIRTALDHYNSAARALSTPRRQLQWSEVVEYAFLSDFDLLRDTRQDISQRPWATPAGRLAMDLHFKLKRAREEIERLNIEIRRVATSIRDEAHFLERMESQVQQTDPLLAHQIHLHRAIRGRFNQHHRRKLQKISSLRGFSGTIKPGNAAIDGYGEAASAWAMPDNPTASTSNDTENLQAVDHELPIDQQEVEEDAEAEMEEEELAQQMTSLLTLAHD